MEDGLPSSCGVSFLPALLQTTLIELQTKNRKNGFQDISKIEKMGGGANGISLLPCSEFLLPIASI